MKILKTVLKHMFSSKSMKYRVYTISWTILACYFWTNKWFETLELTTTIVIGKFLYYGIWEFWHIEIDIHHWSRFKKEVYDCLLLITSLFIEVAILYLLVGKLSQK